jgi:hypothetical protein
LEWNQDQIWSRVSHVVVAPAAQTIIRTETVLMTVPEMMRIIVQAAMTVRWSVLNQDHLIPMNQYQQA